MPLPIRALTPRFDPRRIANLTGWFDALDSAGYTAASNRVSDWLDKSGNGHTASQTTMNNQPTLTVSSGNTPGSTVAVLNGRQALYFDGSNDEFTSSAAFHTSHSRTVIYVCRTVGTSGNQAVVCFGELTATVPKFCPLEGGATVGTKNVLTDITVRNAATTADRDSTAPHISCHTQSSSKVYRYFLNGTSLALTGLDSSGGIAVNQTNFAALRIGRHFLAGTFLAGFLGEILVYDRELSTQERDAVTRYLGSRWGITVA